jgi:hypothetical protein
MLTAIFLFATLSAGMLHFTRQYVNHFGVYEPVCAYRVANSSLKSWLNPITLLLRLVDYVVGLMIYVYRAFTGRHFKQNFVLMLFGRLESKKDVAPYFKKLYNNWTGNMLNLLLPLAIVSLGYIFLQLYVNSLNVEDPERSLRDLLTYQETVNHYLRRYAFNWKIMLALAALFFILQFFKMTELARQLRRMRQVTAYAASLVAMTFFFSFFNDQLSAQVNTGNITAQIDLFKRENKELNRRNIHTQRKKVIFELVKRDDVREALRKKEQLDSLVQNIRNDINIDINVVASFYDESTDLNNQLNDIKFIGPKDYLGSQSPPDDPNDSGGGGGDDENKKVSPSSGPVSDTETPTGSSKAPFNETPVQNDDHTGNSDQADVNPPDDTGEEYEDLSRTATNNVAEALDLEDAMLEKAVNELSPEQRKLYHNLLDYGGKIAWTKSKDIIDGYMGDNPVISTIMDALFSAPVRSLVDKVADSFLKFKSRFSKSKNSASPPPVSEEITDLIAKRQLDLETPLRSIIQTAERRIRDAENMRPKIAILNRQYAIAKAEQDKRNRLEEIAEAKRRLEAEKEARIAEQKRLLELQKNSTELVYTNTANEPIEIIFSNQRVHERMFIGKSQTKSIWLPNGNYTMSVTSKGLKRYAQLNERQVISKPLTTLEKSGNQRWHQGESTVLSTFDKIQENITLSGGRQAITVCIEVYRVPGYVLIWSNCDRGFSSGRYRF